MLAPPKGWLRSGGPGLSPAVRSRGLGGHSGQLPRIPCGPESGPTVLALPTALSGAGLCDFLPSRPVRPEPLFRPSCPLPKIAQREALGNAGRERAGRDAGFPRSGASGPALGRHSVSNALDGPRPLRGPGRGGHLRRPYLLSRARSLGARGERGRGSPSPATPAAAPRPTGDAAAPRPAPPGGQLSKSGLEKRPRQAP